MRQVILDTNAVRYFYQIECCNGKGVQDKVMKKYHFDQQKYIQFLRGVSSISIPATTKFELFFQAYRKGEPDLLLRYNELMQRYKEMYGIDIFVINPQEPELKFDQKQLADDLKTGLIQTELYIKPRIKHEVKIMHGLFLTLIGTLSDMLYKDLEIDTNIANGISELLSGKMYMRLYDLYNQYYLDEKQKMRRDDVDTKLDEILLDSTRNVFIFWNAAISKDYPEKLIEDAKVLFGAKNTSEYLRVLLQLGTKYTRNDYFISLEKALNQLRLTKDFDETETGYFRFLLQNALNGAKWVVRKNDIADYTIITMLSEKVTLKAIDGNAKKEELKLITFDKKIYDFSRQENVMYDETIYNEFLSEIV